MSHLPSPADVIVGAGAGLTGCLVAAFALHAAWHGRRRLLAVCGAGATLFVIGVVGQRAFPSDDDVLRLGRSAAEHVRPGPWDAGVSIPVVHVRTSPVEIAGLLLAAVGLSLSLFFEAPSAGAVPNPSPRRRFVEEDSV